MKLKLIRQVFSGDRESWRRLSLFEVVEGEKYQVEDWRAVLSAARDEGVEVSQEGDGYPGGPFAREPAIDWWPNAWDEKAKATLTAHLTIEQSGGLDI